jgi:hypothetical protein
LIDDETIKIKQYGFAPYAMLNEALNSAAERHVGKRQNRTQGVRF